MDALKILIIAFEFGPPNASKIYTPDQTIVWKLIERISRNYAIWVLTSSTNREDVLTAMSRGGLEGVHVHFVDPPRTGALISRTLWGGGGAYQSWQKPAGKYAMELHTDVGFDAVHHLSSRYDWIPDSVASRLSLPFIWGPLGGGEGYPRALETQLSLGSKVRRLHTRLMRRLGRNRRARQKCLRKAQAILVSNRETRREIPRMYWEKVSFFPWAGVSRDDIPRLERSFRSGDSFRILTAIGNWDEGVELVLSAFRRHVKRFPKDELLIVTDSGLRDKAMRRILAYESKESVEVLAWESSAAFIETAVSCDVFLCPDYREEAGSLMISAMAARIPIVGLDFGGPGIYIHPEVGFKVPMNSSQQIVKDWVQCLEALKTDRTARRKMAFAARGAVRRNYTWFKLGKRLEEIYAETLLQEENIHSSRRGEGRFFY